MIQKKISIELPVMSAHDAAEIGRRVVLLDGYARAMATSMGLAPYDALQPAALLVATHGLNNELGGIIAALAQPAMAEKSDGSEIGEYSDKLAKVVVDSWELLRSLYDVANKLEDATKNAIEVMGNGIER